jgi:hypothetical protein
MPRGEFYARASTGFPFGSLWLPIAIVVLSDTWLIGLLPERLKREVQPRANPR